MNDFGINCSLSVVKRVLGELQASSDDLLMEGFQTLPAALDFLRESVGAYTAFETEPPDGRREEQGGGGGGRAHVQCGRGAPPWRALDGGRGGVPSDSGGGGSGGGGGEGGGRG